MTVTWTSGYDITEATPFVEWGSKGELVRSPAGTLNFNRNSLCGVFTFLCTCEPIFVIYVGLAESALS